MAERRMIHKKASVSTDLNELRDRMGSDAGMFYLLMIPHFDRWGCVPDDPAKLKAMVVPMWDDVVAADVKRWTAWMVRRGMLVRVTGPKGDRGLQSTDFHSHQRGTEFNRETQSDFEPPEITAKWVRPERKGKSPDLQGGHLHAGGKQAAGHRGAALKGRERKGSETSLSLPPTPLPVGDEGAATSPDPSPGAQAQSPEVQVKSNGGGKRLVDDHDGEPVKTTRDLILASVTNPATRAALEQGGQA